MFAPKVNSIKKKSGKMTGYAPEVPELGFKAGMKTGNPSRTNTGSIKKPK